MARIRTWKREGEALLSQIKETSLCEGQLALWYVGQCGVIVKSGETVIAIDPVLADINDGKGHSFRYYQPPFMPEEFRADILLCTHGHDDHMNIPTVKGMAAANPDLKIVVPGGCAAELIKAGVKEEQILSAGCKENLVLPVCGEKTIRIKCIQAAHPVHEVTEKGEELSLSYSITFADDTRLLHTGDTYLTDQYYTDLMALERTDVFMAPINGGDYFRTRRNCIGNVSPIETAHLAVDLKADVTIPLHFDMMKGNTVDPLNFVDILWEKDPSAQVELPALGQRLIYMR